MKIQNTSNVHNEKLNILITGESGAGKTTLIKTIPVKTLLISAENGLLSLRGQDIDFFDIRTDDEGKPVAIHESVNRLGEVFQYLQTEEARKTYKCIALDSLTEISQALMDNLNIQYPNKSDSLKKYGDFAEKMTKLIKAFRDLPHYHCVVIALAKVVTDENGRRYYAVDIIGKSADKIVALFDEVLFLGVQQDEDGNKKRILITDKTDRVIAKDRSSKLNQLEEADLKIIFDKILTPIK